MTQESVFGWAKEKYAEDGVDSPWFPFRFNAGKGMMLAGLKLLARSWGAVSQSLDRTQGSPELQMN
jgi:hypothetical protein